MSSCKEIDIFEMVGGKFVCVIKRYLRVVSAKYIFKIVKKNKEDLGHLISQYAYSTF
jgi:hypothetical protein